MQLFIFENMSTDVCLLTISVPVVMQVLLLKKFEIVNPSFAQYKAGFNV